MEDVNLSFCPKVEYKIFNNLIFCFVIGSIGYSLADKIIDRKESPDQLALAIACIRISYNTLSKNLKRNLQNFSSLAYINIEEALLNPADHKGGYSIVWFPVLLLKHKHGISRKTISFITECTYNLIDLRKWSDDLHDWEEDLNLDIPTRVGREILKWLNKNNLSSKNRKGVDYIFWKKVLPHTIYKCRHIIKKIELNLTEFPSNSYKINLQKTLIHYKKLLHQSIQTAQSVYPPKNSQSKQVKK